MIRHPRLATGPQERSRAGTGLLEPLVAVTLVLLAVLGFSQLMVGAVRTADQAEEATVAREAARAMLDQMRAAQFSTAFAEFNASAEDDPSGFETGFGSGFDVDGLVPVDGDADGMVGEILFPTVDGAPQRLREDVKDAALAMPRDLNGDDVVDDADHSGDYEILPVVIRVRWRGVAGDSVVEFHTILSELP